VRKACRPALKCLAQLFPGLLSPQTNLLQEGSGGLQALLVAVGRCALLLLGLQWVRGGCGRVAQTRESLEEGGVNAGRMVGSERVATSWQTGMLKSTRMVMQAYSQPPSSPLAMHTLAHTLSFLCFSFFCLCLLCLWRCSLPAGARAAIHKGRKQRLEAALAAAWQGHGCGICS
jgi:hypothetical protein